LKILYICTRNRCRSILSEAITNARAKGVLIARSAGSQPAGEVHPVTLRYLARGGYSVAGLQSESWDVYADWQPDLVITVCDRAAGESCPLYFGSAVKQHWGLPDPSAITDNSSESEIEAAFESVIEQIEQRVDALKQLATRPKSEWPAALETLLRDS
jgi:arsenate reductase